MTTLMSSNAKALAIAFEAERLKHTSYTEDDLLRDFVPNNNKGCAAEMKQSITTQLPKKLKTVDVASSGETAIVDDPLCAKFFDEFMKDPKEEQARLNNMREQERARLEKTEYYRIINSNKHHPLRKNRRMDLRLNSAELELYQKHGFVVSERLASDSFGSVYYDLYSDDLPVFVSADSILHAWHMSFSSLLKEMEALCLLPTLQSVLWGMHNALPEEDVQQPTEAMKAVDVFLSVALSLLNGTGERSHPTKYIGGDRQVRQTLADIRSLATGQVKIFGEVRTIDFSQFEPRGHYKDSKELRRYFHVMMWLGRTEFRLCEGSDASNNQMQACLLLVHLLSVSEKVETLTKFNKLLVNLVGETDSLDAFSFLQIIRFGGVSNLSNPTEEDLKRVEKLLISQDVGVEVINSQPRMEGERSTRSFAFIGQKFTVDAFVFSQVTFDNIMWEGQKVQRRRPSGLDVAFSVFGNNHAVSEITQRIKSTDGNKWRDGKPYAHQLVALRKTIDATPEEAWDGSIYMMWLNALRALSRVPVEIDDPVLQSDAWCKRLMCAQLGSWTELKHDTVLYAKQAYGFMTACEYPDVLVEPVPEFFVRMDKMAQTLKNVLDEVDMLRQRNSGYDLCTFLDGFSDVMQKLGTACTLQLKKEAVPDVLNKFLRHIVSVSGGSGPPRYNGWYPSLFYKERKDSCKFKPRVTDIFTAPQDPETGDPGGVVHVGTGKVFMALMAVDGVAFAGPVFSHYEFETSVDKRLSDDVWEKVLTSPVGGRMRPIPEWMTSSYVCPSNH